MNPFRRADGWYDYGPTTVNQVPNSQTANAISVRALEDFHFEDAVSIAIEASCKDAGVEPWEITHSQVSKAKSTSSAASNSFSLETMYTSSRTTGPTGLGIE